MAETAQFRASRCRTRDPGCADCASLVAFAAFWCTLIVASHRRSSYSETSWSSEHRRAGVAVPLRRWSRSCVMALSLLIVGLWCWPLSQKLRRGAARGGPKRQARPNGLRGNCKIRHRARSRWLLRMFVYPVFAILFSGMQRLGQMDRQFRHPDPDLHHAGLGAEHRRRPRRPARSGLRRLLRGRRLFLCTARHRPSDLSFWMLPAAFRNSGCVLGHDCSAFRCCGCAAIISPSSRWHLAKSSALVLINFTVDLTNGYRRASLRSRRSDFLRHRRSMPTGKTASPITFGTGVFADSTGRSVPLLRHPLSLAA